VSDSTAMTDRENNDSEGERIVYGVTDIMRFLPHRYPFLLVDRIVELEADHRIVGLKNVTMNEQFFQGHFPGAPVMPGVLIIESMAQVAGVLIYRDLPDKEKKLIYFRSIENAKFRRPVVPGDQLRIEMELLSRRSNFGKMQGRATVDGKLAAEAIVTFAVVEHPGT
jgi:beta-hydroxyacyl-ACP dehydratase FabZ